MYSADFMGEEDTKWITAYTEDVYIIPYGFCKKVRQDAKKFKIQSTMKSTLIIVDPSLDNKLRLSAMENGKIEFGPVDESNFEEYTFEVETR